MITFFSWKMLTPVFSFYRLQIGRLPSSPIPKKLGQCKNYIPKFGVTLQKQQ